MFAESGPEVNDVVRSKRGAFALRVRYPFAMRTRIKELREARRLTVEALGKLAGISKSHMSDLENGKKALSTERRIAIAKALGVMPLDLMEPGELEPDILELVRVARRLAPGDRAAVLRHAQVLDPGEGAE